MLKRLVFREIDCLSRNVNNIYESIFRKYGLHRGQFLLVSRIVEQNRINLKELSKITRVDKTTVTKAIQKLELAGYILKEYDIDDNRIIHLVATEKCISLYNKIIMEKNQVLSLIMDNFTAEDVDFYIKMTKQLNGYLDRKVESNIK